MMHLASVGPFIVGAILLTQTTLDLKMPFCRSCSRRQAIGGTLSRVAAFAVIPCAPLVTLLIHRWSSVSKLDAGAIGTTAAMGLFLLGAIAGAIVMRVRRYRWDGTYVWFPRLPAATSAAWESVNQHSRATWQETATRI